jgi:serpin B
MARPRNHLIACLCASGLTILVPNLRAEAPPLSQEFVDRQNRFGMELFQKLAAESRDNNLCISPSSIQLALAMTYAGARGETARQMANVLQLGPPSGLLHSEFGNLRARLNASDKRSGLQLRTANRIWGQRGYRFAPSFLELTNKHYGAELGQVDFLRQPDAARQTINQWTAEQTHDKITALLSPGAIGSDTRLVLTNALYFLGEWVYPFDKRIVADAPFQIAAGRQVQATFMTQFQRLRYANQNGIQTLELPYRGSILSLLVLLPEEADGLKALEASLTASAIAEIAAKLRPRPVQVYLPQFRSKAQVELASTLSAMGMSLPFTSGADFSGIATTEDLFLSAVIHETWIDVNTKGTEAAAATAVVADAAPAPPQQDPVEFRADRPFFYLVRDRRDGNVLFLGRMADPAE